MSIMIRLRDAALTQANPQPQMCPSTYNSFMVGYGVLAPCFNLGPIQKAIPALELFVGLAEVFAVTASQLNICPVLLVPWGYRRFVPHLLPKFMCWNPRTNMMVLGVEAFGRCSGREHRTLISEINSHIRETTQSSLVPSIMWGHSKQ